jgi:hypothetical protein
MVEAFVLGGKIEMVAPYVPPAPIVVLDVPGIRLAHLTHNLHDHDRWSQGYVLVEAAEILTWAERGMPLNEHCRTPLCPNSYRERIAPGLIFLAVRRGRCTKYRGESLRIAWTWMSEFTYW